MKNITIITIVLFSQMIFTQISFASVVGLNSSSQLINPTVIDFENIDWPFSSMNTREFEHPSLSFEDNPQVSGIGGSIFPAANNGIKNSVLTSLFSVSSENAPLGVFGQRIYFNENVLSFGFDIQDLSPLFGAMQGDPPRTVFNESFGIIFRAFNETGNLIGEKNILIDHMPDGNGRFFSGVHFMGISSNGEFISRGDIIYNIGRNSNGYAIDNLSFSSQQAVVPIPASLLLFLSALATLVRFFR